MREQPIGLTASWFKTIRQTLWSIDALLIVLAYTALILVLPIPKNRRYMSER